MMNLDLRSIESDGTNIVATLFFENDRRTYRVFETSGQFSVVWDDFQGNFSLPTMNTMEQAVLLAHRHAVREFATRYQNWFQTQRAYLSINGVPEHPYLNFVSQHFII